MIFQKLTSYNVPTGDPVCNPMHIHEGLPVVTEAFHPMLMVTCTSTTIFDPLPIITSTVPHVTTAMPIADLQPQHAAPPPQSITELISTPTMTMGISNDGSQQTTNESAFSGQPAPKPSVSDNAGSGW